MRTALHCLRKELAPLKINETQLRKLAGKHCIPYQDFLMSLLPSFDVVRMTAIVGAQEGPVLPPLCMYLLKSRLEAKRLLFSFMGKSAFARGPFFKGSRNHVNSSLRVGLYIEGGRPVGLLSRLHQEDLDKVQC